MMTIAKLNKMDREMNRHMKAAESEHELAKNLFSIGSRDFAQPLELAHQHYGAAQEINKLLKSFGYHRYTKREIAAIKRGIKQKSCGVIIVILGLILSIPERDITGAIALVPLGLFLMFSKKYVLTR